MSPDYDSRHDGPQPPLRVLGRTSSINARKVPWTCDELGLEYQREDWGSGFRWYGTPIERPALPAVEAYYARLMTRPAFPAHARPDVP